MRRFSYYDLTNWSNAAKMGIKTAELLPNLLVNSSMIKDATTVDYTGSRKKNIPYSN